MSPETITPESLPPAEPSAESPAAPSEVTLDKIQQADKYVGVQEKATTAKEQEALRQRASVLEQAWRGKEDSPEADQLRQSVAEFCTPAALATALEQQRSTGKTVIPESLLRNQDIKDELARIAERIQRGAGFDTLLREANQAGEVNPDWLRSLKVLGTMIMQRHAPDGDQNKWRAMSEPDKQLVRFAELLTNGTLIYSVRRRMEQKTLAPEVAGYLRQNFLGFGQNEDIPNAFKRDLIKITDRLAAYQRGQAEPSSSEGARADAATADTQSVLDEAQPTTTAETVVGKTDLTTIEKKQGLFNEPWQLFIEKKNGDTEQTRVIDQRREDLSALARVPADPAILDQIAVFAAELSGPSAAKSGYLIRNRAC